MSMGMRTRMRMRMRMRPNLPTGRAGDLGSAGPPERKQRILGAQHVFTEARGSDVFHKSDFGASKH
eukprot:3450633-Karenia_brevis.AAC.1